MSPLHIRRGGAVRGRLLVATPSVLLVAALTALPAAPMPASICPGARCREVS